EAHAQGSDRGRKVLGLTVLAISGAAAACIAIFAIRPALIISVLFGSAYVAVAPYLALFTLAMYFVALITVFANYFIATHRYGFLWIFLLGIFAEAQLIATHHATAGSVASAMAVSTGLLACLMIVAYLVERRSQISA